MKLKKKNKKIEEEHRKKLYEMSLEMQTQKDNYNKQLEEEKKRHKEKMNELDEINKKNRKKIIIEKNE